MIILIIWNGAHILKIMYIHLGKKINQIDLKTKKIIKTFNCISDAKRELNVKNYINISMVCHGQRNQAYGFDWNLQINIFYIRVFKILKLILFCQSIYINIL